MEEIEVPQNIEAEAVILGTMLTSIDHSNEVFDKLSSEDFYSIDNKRVFSAMMRLYSKDMEIVPETVYHTIEPREKLIRAYLYELKRYSVVCSLKTFIESVIEKSKLRKFVDLQRDSMKEFRKEGITSDSFFPPYTARLDKIVTDNDESTFRTSKKVIENFAFSGKSYLSYIEDMQEDYKNGINDLNGLDTGYSDLNETLSGLCPGHYIVIAARPGVGKTTLMLNLVNNVIQNDVSALVFSMEMRSEEVIEKILSINSLVPPKVAKTNPTSEQYQQIVVATKKIEACKLSIEESGSLTIEQIRSRIKRSIQSHGTQIVFIDYLGCISPGKTTNTKEEGVRDISGALRDMAKTFKIPFVIVCQENRESEKSDQERAPKKTDLGQSGSIEQDAHSIIMLRRPEIQDPYSKPGVLEAYIVKNRFGEMKKLQFRFDGPTGKIGELKNIERLIRDKENE